MHIIESFFFMKIIEKSEIKRYIDYVAADRFVTYGEIKKNLDDAIKSGYLCVCVPPSFLNWSKKYVGDRIRICSLVDFPLGNATVNTKVASIKEGLKNGADEFEVMINHNELKSGNVEFVRRELLQLKRAARRKLFKAAAEPSVLSETELYTFLKCALNTRTDYVSIGTSFGISYGANLLEKIKESVKGAIKI